MSEIKYPFFLLPPKSPEYNCNVERANGTFKYELFAQYKYPGNFDLLQVKLKKFILFYNSKSLYYGITLLTPFEFYELIKNGDQKSHMC